MKAFSSKTVFSTTLELALVFFVSFLTPAKGVAETFCAAELDQISVRRAFVAEYQETIEKDMPRIGLEAKDFSTAMVFQLSGEGPSASKNAFVLLARNDKAWWFASSPESAKNLQKSGRFDDPQGAAALKDLMGSYLSDAKSKIYYRFDQEAKKYQKITEEEARHGRVDFKSVDTLKLDPAKVKFLETFGEKLKDDAFRSELTPYQLEEGAVTEVFGTGAFTRQKAYFVSYRNNGDEKVWFFAENKKSLFKKFIGGRGFDTRAVKELRKNFGDTFVSADGLTQYDYNPAHGAFERLSQDLITKHREWVANFAIEGSVENRDFLNRFDGLIYSAFKRGQLNLDRLKAGHFLAQLNPSVGVSPFYLFLPENKGERAYLFNEKEGQPYLVELYEGEIAATPEMDFSLTTAKPNPLESEKGRSWQHVYELSNHQLVVHNNSYGNGYFSGLKKSTVAAVKRALLEKDHAADNFEYGPYAEFVSKYLIDFFRTAIAGTSFEALKEIEIVGQGHSFKNPALIYGVFKMGDSHYYYYYYADANGKGQFGRFGWMKSENVAHVSMISGYAGGAEPFFARFGRQFVLPSRKLVTVEQPSLLNPERHTYSVTDLPHDVRRALEAFTEGPVSSSEGLNTQD